MKPLTKAIFPVAGLGTRFLPATKAQPKEMLPIIDKPLIQFAVEEAMAAGVTQLIFVTGRTKRAIADHFDATPELDRLLREKGRDAVAEEIKTIIPPHVTCIYIRQPEALGLGHAVHCAAPLIGPDEPFAVLLADDLMLGEPPVLAQMAEVQRATGRSVLAVNTVPLDEIASYGVVAAEDPGEGNSAPVTDMVEKPAPGDAPSNLAVVGRYILRPEIMPILADLPPGRGGEIQLTDAIRQLIPGTGVEAFRYRGRRYDCGSKLGYLEATVDMGLSHPEYGPHLRAHLRGTLGVWPKAGELLYRVAAFLARLGTPAVPAPGRGRGPSQDSSRQTYGRQDVDVVVIEGMKCLPGPLEWLPHGNNVIILRRPAFEKLGMRHADAFFDEQVGPL